MDAFHTIIDASSVAAGFASFSILAPLLIALSVGKIIMRVSCGDVFDAATDVVTRKVNE